MEYGFGTRYTSPLHHVNPCKQNLIAFPFIVMRQSNRRMTGERKEEEEREKESEEEEVHEESPSISFRFFLTRSSESSVTSQRKHWGKVGSDSLLLIRFLC